MKKVFIILGILIVVILVLKFYQFGSKRAMMGASLIELDVPKLSTLDNECCTYKAEFKSFRSTVSLKKELEKNIKNNYKLECNNGKYHYSIKDDVTIKDYGVKSGFIMNYFYIEYEKGNLCFEVFE